MALSKQHNPNAPWPDAALIIFLIGLDVAARLLLHVPNVSPVAASALFAGMTLRRRSLALLVPLAALIQWADDHHEAIRSARRDFARQQDRVVAKIAAEIEEDAAAAGNPPGS